MKALFAILLAALLLAPGCSQGRQAAPPSSQQNSTATVNGGNQMAKTPGNTTKTAAKGDTVSVDYVGKLENGTVFDTSLKEEAQKANLEPRPSYAPLEFTVGAGQMIAGFDSAVVGMKEGEEKTVTLPPGQAYGQWSSDRVITIPVANIGNATNISVGSMLFAQNGAIGRVTAISGGNATVDFNHELAGKTLVFTIKMISIKKG